MRQDEVWMEKYNEVVKFIETNKRNPSKHSMSSLLYDKESRLGKRNGYH